MYPKNYRLNIVQQKAEKLKIKKNFAKVFPKFWLCNLCLIIILVFPNGRLLSHHKPIRQNVITVLATLGRLI